MIGIVGEVEPVGPDAVGDATFIGFVGVAPAVPGGVGPLLAGAVGPDAAGVATVGPGVGPGVGIVAVGIVAVGIVAVGIVAVGIVAVGIVALGCVPFDAAGMVGMVDGDVAVEPDDAGPGGVGVGVMVGVDIVGLVGACAVLWLSDPPLHPQVAVNNIAVAHNEPRVTIVTSRVKTRSEI